ncbi:MAG: hypothetical protein HY755_09835 [Nitrospirae bacterium]|nr:hypothetical protein [Nitrospirota bacterium]MBI4848777.1 hypothetical protein [Nitrospirota bacterium]
MTKKSKVQKSVSELVKGEDKSVYGFSDLWDKQDIAQALTEARSQDTLPHFFWTR